MFAEVDWIQKLNIIKNKKIICLVDGEHYPPVTKWTVGELNRVGTVKSLIFLGGTEKVENAVEEIGSDDYRIVMGGENFGETLEILKEVLKGSDVDTVIDLSDEPVLDYRKRFSIASIVLKHGKGYLGADFYFNPPGFKDILQKPSLGIIGTGKRVGKTAVSISVGRILDEEGFSPVIVAMGRGGPPEPEILHPNEMELTPDTLIEVAEGGGHAASDYWEDAILAGVTTVGCRRCGGGMAGNTFSSNVLEGAELTNDLGEKIVIMEGSGATLPPVKTDGNIVVVGAGQPPEYISGFFGQYRLLISDLAVITMSENPMATPEKVNSIEEDIREINPEIEIATTVFRPEPLGDIQGKDVFLASTAPVEVLSSIKKNLQETYNCNIKGVSGNLSNRTLLKKELSAGLTESDILLTEIKAASIDVAARSAKENNVEIVFLHNRPVLKGGTVKSFESAVLKLHEKLTSGRES